MITKSIWVYSLPCQNSGLSIDKNPVSVVPNKDDFIYCNECFGKLFYARDRGPIFYNSFLQYTGSTERFHINAPIRVDIEITANCLLRCKHCYFGTKSKSEIPVATLKLLFEQLSAMGTVGVQLVGGEPFLHSDLPAIVNCAKENKLKVELFTGGFGAKMETIKQVRGNIDFLAIDLDGIEETHDNFRGRRGSFQAALKMLNAFSGSGTFIDVTMILSQFNLGEIEQVYEIASAHGASSFNVRLLHPSGDGSKIADMSLLSGVVGDSVNERIDALNAKGSLLVRKPSRFNCTTGTSSFFGCPGGKFTITVKTNGDVVKCNVSQDVLGNIFTSPFPEIWKTISTREAQRSCDRVQQNPSQCGFSQMCGGPCEMLGLDEAYCFSLATK